MIFQDNPFTALQGSPVLLFAIIPLVLMIPTIALLVFFLTKFIKTKQKMLGYLAALFILYMINNILQMNHFLALSVEQAEHSYTFAQISGMLMLFTLIILFEMFYRNTQFSRRQTIITILLFMVIGGLLTNPDLETIAIGRGYIVSISNFSTLGLLRLIFNVTATISLLYVLHKSRKSVWSSKQKSLITWLIIGSIFGVLMPSIQSIPLPEQFDETMIFTLQIIQSIPQSIGMLIIGISFLKVSKNPWLLQRQKVDFLVVYSHGGLSLFSKTFSKEMDPDNTFLLAGAFSAVTSLIEETTKSTGNVEAIMLQGKELRLINRKGCICALLVEFTTQASEWALEKFTTEFEQRFEEELLNFEGNISQFDSAEDIVKKFFS